MRIHTFLRTTPRFRLLPMTSTISACSSGDGLGIWLVEVSIIASFPVPDWVVAAEVQLVWRSHSHTVVSLTCALSEIAGSRPHAFLCQFGVSWRRLMAAILIFPSRTSRALAKVWTPLYGCYFPNSTSTTNWLSGTSQVV